MGVVEGEGGWVRIGYESLSLFQSVQTEMQMNSDTDHHDKAISDSVDHHIVSLLIIIPSLCILLSF